MNYDQYRRFRKLSESTSEEQEKLVYEWIKKGVFSLKDFREFLKKHLTKGMPARSRAI